MLSPLGGPKKERLAPPITLPKLSLPDPDENEIVEAAIRVAERKTIRLGVDAWHLTQKSASFENWKLIGKALKIGRDIATRAAGVTTGKHYAKAFYSWADRHGFDSMHKSDRWAAVDLAENIVAIEAWRVTLPERERRRLIHPLSSMRRWRRSLTPKTKPDALADAEAAWRRFVSCVEALPPDQAAPFWREAQTKALAVLGHANVRFRG